MDHRVRLPLALAVCTLIPLAAALGAGPGDAPPFGFGVDSGVAQRLLEQKFDAQINPAEMTEWLKGLSSAANNVGTPHDRANAEWVREQFGKWGWNAQIEPFEVLYPTLKHHALELVAPGKFAAALTETPIAGDATSSRSASVGAYNVYGADGDVTGELVYVNYGMDDDYRDLTRRGIEVKGKIVIVRYGGGWRGLKPKLAQARGAVGCIIYSDPRDDGYGAGDTYPQGGWRPGTGIQRGSVLDVMLHPGDPLAAGVGATSGARRVSLAQARTLVKIPVLPISYGDAQPLLAALGGPVAPPAWRGALPLTYHLGPGPARVHLAISSDWSQKTVYDVIARVPGAEAPDEWIVRGNHRDAWVFGAWDPLSGHVAMLAEAKAIGALLKSGWRPKRTLVFASWDGEEPGLLGSTAWAEAHAEELQHKAVVYLNSDENARGFLNVGGSPSLQHFMNDVAGAVPDPQTGVTVGARNRARLMVRGYERGATESDHRLARIAASGGDLPLQGLGSGSDFVPFQNHLGIASLNIEYDGEGDQAGAYHSAYDTFEHYMRFGDPRLRYGVAEAQTVGRAELRLADIEVLPMHFGSFADAVAGYVDELHRLADDKRHSAEELARLLDRNAFGLATDPTRAVGPPPREPEVPYFEFAPLDNAVARLKKGGAEYDELYARLASGSLHLSAQRRGDLNGLLRGMEQTLTDDRGLPGRDWYRHLIYAPGTLTGYGVKTLPGVREGIEQNRYEEANRYVPLTAAALNAYGDRLERASALLRNTAVDGTPGRSGSLAANARVPQHIFLIVLENQSYHASFGEDSPAPFLARTLPLQGALLPNYYGIGHSSLPNYIALIGGQAPNRETQLDCPVFTEFRLTQTELDAHGQALGRGCVYPSKVKSLPDQLEARGFSWKAYMEDMGADPQREARTCGHSAIGSQEKSYNAAPDDRYAARHDPFVYFHAIIDDQARCDTHVVNLDRLDADLQSLAATANYNFITPNLCNDGHDPQCGAVAGGMAAVNQFLRKWVPLITASPAFRKDGLLIVTFDETDMVGAEGSSACCGEFALPGSTYPPGLNGPGGGRVGAVLLSPFIKPGTVSVRQYNHYSLLRSVEDFFGLEHLGYAAEPGLQALGPDIFTKS